MLSGGCQCGAVRFRVAGPPRHVNICHCRMCQKQFAAPFGAFGSWAVGDVDWSRGTRKAFQSSDAVARGFCGDCGTPLTFEAAAGGKHIAIALCAFDDPSAFSPGEQLEGASRVSWLPGLNDIPFRSDEAQAAQDAKYGPRTSFQHPDHETAVWPPAERGA